MPDFTELLVAAGVGDRQAVVDLFALVYEDLKRLAARQLTREGPGQTLQPTALVHEAYLRRVGVPHDGTAGQGLSCASRRQFFAAAQADPGWHGRCCTIARSPFVFFSRRSTR